MQSLKNVEVPGLGRRQFRQTLQRVYKNPSPFLRDLHHELVLGFARRLAGLCVTD